MKQVNILLTLFFTVILTTGVFGATTLDSFTINVTNATTFGDVNADITYTDGSDFNALCLSTSDGNDDTSCIYMNGPGSGATIDINSDVINGIPSDTSEGTHTIYATIKLDDGNFAGTKNDDVNIDTSAPTLNASYPADSGDYNVDDITFDFNVLDTYSGIDSANAIIKVNGIDMTGDASYSTNGISGGINFNFTITDMNEGDHNFSIDVNDDVGNNLSTTGDFTVDLTAPSGISVSATTSWTNEDKPTFSLSATENGSGMSLAGFSCEPDGPWDEITYASTINTFDITANEYDCNTDDGNKSIYVKFRDAAGNWSTSASTNVKYDNNAPNAPTGLSATAGDEEVELTWTAPIADDLSGNDEYRIYKNGSQTATTTSTSKTITGLTNGTEYDFEVTIVDNAGNESSASNEVSSTPTSGVEETPPSEETSDITADVYVKRDGEIVEYVKTGDTLVISTELSDDGQNVRIRYKRYDPIENTETLEGPEDDVDSLEEEYEVTGDHEKICFWSNGTDEDDYDWLSETDCVYLDEEEPEVEWVTAPNEMIGSVDVEVTATDNHEINKVRFYLDDVQVDVGDKDDDDYTGVVDSTKYENGEYEFKVEVTDKAGNMTELTKTVTVNNYVSPEEKAQKAIEDAKEAKKVVEGLMDYFAKEGVIFPIDMVTEKIAADLLLEEAKDLNTDDPEIVQTKAEEAKAKYENINTTAKFEEVPNKVAVYDIPSDVDATLSALGLTNEQKIEAAAIIEESGIERKLVIVKVGDGNNAEYQAKIEIKLANSTDSGELKVIEYIPKELVASASEIFSDYNFVILEDDPVIEFTVSVASGAEKTITYGIGGMTEAEADALITNNVIASFASPPVVLKASTDTSNLKATPNWTMIISYSLAIIVIVVVVGIVAFLALQQDDNPFGKKGSIMDKINAKIKELKKSNKGNGKKWAYKGKK